MSLLTHQDHLWKQVGRCVYCEPCGTRLYQGRVPKTLEKRRAMAREVDYAIHCAWLRSEKANRAMRRGGQRSSRVYPEISQARPELGACRHLVFDEDGARTCILCAYSYDRAEFVEGFRTLILSRDRNRPLVSPWTSAQRSEDAW